MEMNKAVTLTSSRNPYLPHADRRLQTAIISYGSTIEEVLTQFDAHPGRSMARLILDGEYIPRTRWSQVCVRPGSIITLQHEAQGGGKGGSNPLMIVLQIAVLAAGFWGGPALAGMMGLSGTAFTLGGAAVTWSGIMSGIIGLGGSILLGSLLAPPTQKISTGLNSGLPNQTYNLSGGSNAMRPWQPLLLIMGEHRVYPDISAKASAKYVHNEQYLSVVFNYGLSDMEEPTIHRIGDTSLAKYTEVEYDWAPNGQGITVVGLAQNTEVLEIQYNLTPDGYGFSGSPPPAYAVGPWSPTRTSADNSHILQVDIHGTVYAFLKTHAGYEGLRVDVQYRKVGDAGWVDTPASIFISNDEPSEQRATMQWRVTLGKYEVHCRAVGWYYDGNANYTQRVREATWETLTSFQQESGDFTGQNRLGAYIKASGQIHGTLDKWSSLCKAQAQLWTPTGWVQGTTRNPAWWYIWFARGRRAAGRVLYGAYLPDSRIDIDNIRAWADWCDLNSLTFDAVIDSSQTCAEVLQKIAAAGLATPSWHTGKLGVVWDEANAPVVAVFGMFNIAKGSFQIQYVSENLAEEIEATYIDRDNNYEQATVRVPVPGVVGTPARTTKVDLFGTTNKAIAKLRACRLAASQYYHRRRITWETDVEGLLVKRGDVVALSHDLTQWAASGRITAWDPSAKVLTLDRDVDRTASDFVQMRWPNGCIEILPCVAGTGTGNTVTLISALPTVGDDGSPLVAPGTGQPYFDWAYQYSPEPTPGKRVKIVSIRPISQYRVQIEAVDDEPGYYAYSGGDYIIPTPLPLEDFTPTNLSVSEELLRATPGGWLCRISLTWKAPSGTDYIIRRQISLQDKDGIWNIIRPWREVDATSAMRYIDTQLEGYKLEYEVAPLVKARGYWGKASITHIVLGRQSNPDNVANFTATINAAGYLIADWDNVDDVDIMQYEIRKAAVGASWDSAELLGVSRSTHFEIKPERGTYDILIKAADTSGLYSATESRVTINAIPPDVGTLSATALGQNLRINIALAGTTPTQFAGFKLRIIQGTSPDWAAGFDIGTGIKAQQWETTGIPPGSWTLMAKALDANEYESENVAYQSIVVPDSFGQNVVAAYDFRAAGWPGIKTDCSVVSGDLVATDTSGNMWAAGNTLMWWRADTDYFWSAGTAWMYPAEAISMWDVDSTKIMWTGTYPAATYMQSFFNASDGRLWFTTTADGIYRIEIRDPYPDAMWLVNANLMWGDSSAQMWRYSQVFTPISTRFFASRQLYDMRIRFRSGAVRPRIYAMKASADAETITETFDDITISSAGTRLPISNTYHKITRVIPAVQSDGSSTATVRTIDKNVRLGPMVQCFDIAGLPTAGTIDAIVQGY